VSGFFSSHKDLSKIDVSSVGASDMPEGEALFFLEMGVMIKKIREKASAFRTKKQQALGIRGQEKSP
jgi:hypothetical protein